MTGSLLLVQILNGLQFGLMLFLISAGLTLVFGVLGFVNLAHGAQYMVGAYLVTTLALYTGSFVVGLLITIPASLIAGYVLDRLVFRHLYTRSHLDQVLATFGLIFVLSEGARLIWGAASLSVAPPEALSGSIQLVDDIFYPTYRLTIIAAGLGVALLLYFVISATRTGMLIRAGASHPALVSALGVDIRRIFCFVFSAGAMLAGFAGAMMAPIVSVDPNMGDNILILAFVVIIVGGVGSVRGAFLAAVIVGLVDTLGRTLAPILLRSVLDSFAANQTGRAIAPMLIYILMAAVLCWRPSGLFSART